MSDHEKHVLEPHFAWHAEQWQQLTQLCEAGRLPHALLQGRLGLVSYGLLRPWPIVCYVKSRDTTRPVVSVSSVI